jgi:hypothetical protein
MSARTFTFSLTPDKYSEVQHGFETYILKASEYGINIEKDGKFTGKAEGQITVANGSVHIRVDEKPFIVPWGVIESKLKELFS